MCFCFSVGSFFLLLKGIGGVRGQNWDFYTLLKFSISAFNTFLQDVKDRFKSNGTFKFLPFLDILSLNEVNLKRVNRCALKFYTLKIESVSYMRVRSKIIISCHLCVLLRVKEPKMLSSKLITHIYNWWCKLFEGKRFPMKNTFYFDVQGNFEVSVKIIEGKHFLEKVKNIHKFC